MAPSLPSRPLVGATLVGGVLAANVLVSPSATVETVASLTGDPYRFGLVVAGLYLVRPLFAWPTTPLAAVVGYGFGAVAGVPIALAGVLATVTPVFFVARRAAAGGAPSGPFATSLETAGDVAGRYYDAAGPIRGVTASRLAPIPSDVATAAAAASGVSLRHLLVGTAIGELPWVIASVAVGASGATLAAGDADVDPGLVAVCALAAAVVLAGPAYRVVRAR